MTTTIDEIYVVLGQRLGGRPEVLSAHLSYESAEEAAVIFIRDELGGLRLPHPIKGVWAGNQGWVEIAMRHVSE